MDRLHNAPILQFFEAIAHVRPCYAETRTDIFGVERLLRDEKESVDLGDRAIDPPLRSHFPPVEDELLRKRRKIFHFFNFCHYRNRGNGREQGGFAKKRSECLSDLLDHRFTKSETPLILGISWKH